MKCGRCRGPYLGCGIFKLWIAVFQASELEQLSGVHLKQICLRPWFVTVDFNGFALAFWAHAVSQRGL